MIKKTLVLTITFVSAACAVDIPGLNLDFLNNIPGMNTAIDYTSEYGSKIADYLPMEEIEQVASYSTNGLKKLGEYTSQGLDKVVELSYLDEAMGLTYDMLNKIKVSEAFEAMGIDSEIAAYMGFPFDIVGSLGKGMVRTMAELPKEVIETTKTLVNLMTNPQEAAEYAKKYFELFKQLATMQPAVHLCHQNCKLDILLRAISTSEPLTDGLEDVRDFLKSHPKEVVFIFFEDYVKDAQKVDELIEKSGLAPFALKPVWDPVEKNGWPTFGWVRKNNRRAVLVTDNNGTAENSKYVLYQPPTIFESKYSSIGDTSKGMDKKERFKELCAERPDISESGKRDSAPRYMTMINLFPEFPLPLDTIKAKDFANMIPDFQKVNNSQEINSERTLNTFVNACAEYGVGPVDKDKKIDNQAKMRRMKPNFIAIDFVDQGEPLKVINGINQAAVDALNKPNPQVELDKLFGPVVMEKTESQK